MTKTETKEYTPEDIEALRARLQVFKNERNLSWGGLAEVTGIASGTVSQWTTGNYEGRHDKVAEKVEKFFNTYQAKAAVRQLAPQTVPGFIETKVAKLVTTQLVWAHNGNITTVTGEPGVGKTQALKNYIATNANAWMITGKPSIKSVVGMLSKLVAVLGLPVRITGVGPNVLSNQVVEFLRGRQGLIIVDEAQEFDKPAIEEFRSFYDEIGTGILFSGNREILTIKDGKGAQLSSRNASRVIIDLPFVEDVDALLDAWKIEDARERKFLTAVAMRPGKGALRSMSKVLEMASMGANGANEPRTLDHMKAAALNQGHRIGGHE